jgi:hypothetical protein
MRPFFKHYGSRWLLAGKLPPPRHPRIVEAFAGGAGYATRYGEGLRVDLIDSDPDTVAIWEYLLGASQEQILALPDLAENPDIRTLGLPRPEMLLLQRWVTSQGSRGNWRMTPSGLRIRPSAPASLWGPEIRARIAAQLPGIQHWRVSLGDYSHADVSTPATWIIDPPYQHNKAAQTGAYGTFCLDYAALGAWCDTLPGDVVCHEGPSADWRPFRPWMSAVTGSLKPGARKRADEQIWTNPSDLVGAQQISLDFCLLG